MAVGDYSIKLNEKNMEKYNNDNILNYYLKTLREVEVKIKSKIEDGYLIKLGKEKEYYENEFDNYTNKEKEETRNNIIESLKEDMPHELPLYYMEDNGGSGLSMKEKYNLYMMESSYKDSLKIKLYKSSFLTKKEDLYKIVSIFSESKIEGAISFSSLEEDLSLFYNLKEEIITKKDFFDKIKESSKEEVLSKIRKMGLDVKEDFQELYITPDYEKKLKSSILNYISLKQVPKMREYNRKLYPKYSFERFTLEFNSGNIPLSSEFIDLNLINSLNALLKIMINNKKEEVSVIEIKNLIDSSINDFGSFLKLNKTEVSKIIYTLFENSLDEVEGHKTSPLKESLILLNDRNKREEKEVNLVKIQTSDVINDKSDKWNTLKAFCYQKLFDNQIIFQKLSTGESYYPLNVTKKVGDKVYNIDFENNDIDWSFSDEEKEYEHQQNLKNNFIKLKVSLINDNPNISREELKLELRGKMDSKISPEALLEEVNYSDGDFTKSDYFIFNNLVIQAPETIIDGLEENLNSFLEIKKNHGFSLLNIETALKYKGKDNFQLLNLIFELNGSSKPSIENLEIIFKILNNKEKPHDLIKNIISLTDYSDEKKLEESLFDYFEILQINMVRDLKNISIGKESVLNKDIFSNSFYVSSLMMLMENLSKELELKYPSETPTEDPKIDPDFLEDKSIMELLGDDGIFEMDDEFEFDEFGIEDIDLSDFDATIG